MMKSEKQTKSDREISVLLIPKKKKEISLVTKLQYRGVNALTLNYLSQ